MQRRVLIVGCGYLGLALGRRLVEEGHGVVGVRRPGGDTAAMRAAGITPWLVDLSRAEAFDSAPGDQDWDWVVQCTAPGGRGEEDYRCSYLDVAARCVARFRRQPPLAFAYVGSTSVYGQAGGQEVDETSPTEPGTATGGVLVATEQLLAEAAAGGLPVRRLRSVGIYGPGRNRLAALRGGQARMAGEGGRWMNLIHRDDLAAAVKLVLEVGRNGSVYNVADGRPVRERDFWGWLCQRTGLPLPPQERDLTTATDGTRGRRRGTTDKRVMARRLGGETGWRPRYSCFREGYEALIREEATGVLCSEPGLR